MDFLQICSLHITCTSYLKLLKRINYGQFILPCCYIQQRIIAKHTYFLASNASLLALICEIKSTIIQVTRENSKFQWTKKTVEGIKGLETGFFTQVAFTQSYKLYTTRPIQKNITVCNTLLLARYDFQKSHLTLFGTCSCSECQIAYTFLNLANQFMFDYKWLRIYLYTPV